MDKRVSPSVDKPLVRSLVADEASIVQYRAGLAYLPWSDIIASNKLALWTLT
jgi:hypothetical protein